MTLSKKNIIFLFFISCLTACCNSSQKYNFIGDGITLNTEALQSAIDECSQNGGGVVTLPKGEYLTGSISLEKGVTLHLEKGATISGSRNPDDYPDKGRRKAVIFAENADDIAISGEGKINGNGDAFLQGNNAPNRPTLVLFFDCKNVNVKGIKMTNAGFWTFRFVRCDGVDIRNVHVEAHANWNNDGFDIESKNVTISDCILDTDDDAICFKSEDPGFIVENITVTNCDVASNCNFIKFGTASAGGFRNVKVTNCKLHKCSRSNFQHWERRVPGVTNLITGIGGIALEVVDGGFMDNIHISDIEMEDVQTPVFIRMGSRQVSEKSWLKDVLIENITASSVSFIASSITGVSGLRPENIVIRNVDFKLKGGGKASDTDMNVSEMEKAYPENRMFGVMLPAYGFYLRHADNIRFDNIKLSVKEGVEERHTIVADDVTGLEIKDSYLQPPVGKKSVVYLRSSKDIRLLRNNIKNAAVYVDRENTSASEVKTVEN